MASVDNDKSASLRLDSRLVAMGLAATRSRARDLILRGFVRVDGRVCAKPGQIVAAAQSIVLADDAPQFVSRGGEKLAAALNHFALDPSGRVCIDIGASTGGFTDVLLRQGAMRVYAIDAGEGQLDTRLRNDPRVVAHEKCDARALTRDIVPEPVDALVADLSFISLSKAIGPAMALTVPGAWMIVLVKPQFEVGPERVSKGGIVRDASARSEAVAGIVTWLAQRPGWRVIGSIPSPIEGGSGNQEFLTAAVFDA